jgi:hypothetical protein
MKKAALLYSGGKDSSLAAVILSKLGYDIILCTASFGINGAWEKAREAARALGFHHKKLPLNPSVLEVACSRIERDGFPKNGINLIHKAALEEVAAGYPVVADGTRRDDRAPKLQPGEIRSLEDRFDTEYIAPLSGIGYRTLNGLTKDMFILEERETDRMEKGDYEAEVWSYMEEMGLDPREFFPKRHIQSRVLGYRSGKSL